MLHTLHLIAVLSTVLTDDTTGASIRSTNVGAFVSSPVLRRTPSERNRRCRSTGRALSRVTRTAGLFLERTDGDDDVDGDGDDALVKTEAKADDGAGGKDETMVGTFLASIPEFSFWDVGNNDEDDAIRKRDLIRSLFRRLANLSLQDYNWRSDYFKKTEADRRVEESLARMMGEDAAYVRPMDATDDKIGPLGRAERKLVQWLSLVIEEEGRRATMIASSQGELIRPMDLQPSGEGGPLSLLESSAVSLLSDIRTSEEERAKTLTLRPKDLEEEKRGPLGEAEYRATQTIERIRESEVMRMEQTRQRGGEMVRPIDVPGPLGELELWYVELFSAELQRARDAVRNDGAFRRPKDASLQGPMGDAEQQVSDALNVIKNEETERLKSIQKVLQENRPMDKDRESILGMLETIIVGIFKGPQLIFRVIDRVNELLQSSTLKDESDDNDERDLPSLPSTRLDGNNGGNGEYE